MCTARLRPLALVAATLLLMSCEDESAFEPSTPTAQPRLVGAPAEDVIPDQYIVVFRDDVRSPAEAANEMAARHGLKIRHTYSHAIRGFSAVVPEGRLEALQRNPRVQSVQPNRYLYIDTHERFRRPAAAQLGVSVAAPSGLAATALSASEIRLTWTDGPDDEDGFEIARSAGAAGPFSKVASVKANVTEYVDGELSSGVEYCYKVRAVAGKGRNKQYSSYTGPACALTLDGAPDEPPSDPRPTDLQATGERGAIALSWNDNSYDETRYAIERCGPIPPRCESFNYVMFAGANATSYTDANVTASLEYCYRVRAMREKGKKITYTEYSNVDCGVPTAAGPPVGAPTDLVATDISHLAVELVWTDGATGEEKFEIERCAGTLDGCYEDSDFSYVDAAAPNAEFFIDGGLTPGTDYVYRVRASTFSEGSSDYSNLAAAATGPTPAAGVCADDGSHDDISTQLWNIRRVKAHRNPTWQATKQAGCALTPWLFVLDTGVDGDHPDLNVVESIDFVTEDGNGADGSGHGTHVAGSAAAEDGDGGVVGVAPGAPIYNFKVCDDEGACAVADILAAIELIDGLKDAAPDQPMVVNLSLGGPGTDDALESAVRASISAGIVYAISAGNGDLGSCFFPADAETFTPARVGDDPLDGLGDPGEPLTGEPLNGAIVTTASDSSDHDDNCNYGYPVTVAAPGVEILSTWPGGGFASRGGASMATPHAAGAAILFLQSNAGASPTDVEAAIVGGLDQWTTDDTPNATGRLNVEGL